MDDRHTLLMTGGESSDKVQRLVMPMRTGLGGAQCQCYTVGIRHGLLLGLVCVSLVVWHSGLVNHDCEFVFYSIWDLALIIV